MWIPIENPLGPVASPIKARILDTVNGIVYDYTTCQTGNAVRSAVHVYHVSSPIAEYPNGVWYVGQKATETWSILLKQLKQSEKG